MSFREETSSGIMKCWLFSSPSMMFQAWFELKHKILREFIVSSKKKNMIQVHVHDGMYCAIT